MSWRRPSVFCPACQAAFDAQPLHALTRRWSAACADAQGTVAGLICAECKGLVRTRHALVAQGLVAFDFANPNQRRRTCAGEKCTAFARMSAAEQKQRRERHEDEVHERLRWCLDRSLTPAHAHVHKAPGSDANFMVRFVHRVRKISLMRQPRLTSAHTAVRRTSVGRSGGREPRRSALRPPGGHVAGEGVADRRL